MTVTCAVLAATAAALIQSNTPIEVKCANLRGATQLLQRRGFKTIVSAGRGTHTWLCAPRAGARTYTAVGRWEVGPDGERGALRIWGPIPVPLGVRLPSKDVGPMDSIRLPVGVLEWAASELERLHPNPKPGRAKLSPSRRIRLAYCRAAGFTE